MAYDLKFHLWAAWINGECLEFQQIQKKKETGVDRIMVCQDTIATLISRKRKKIQSSKAAGFFNSGINFKCVGLMNAYAL